MSRAVSQMTTSSRVASEMTDSPRAESGLSGAPSRAASQMSTAPSRAASQVSAAPSRAASQTNGSVSRAASKMNGSVLNGRVTATENARNSPVPSQRSTTALSAVRNSKSPHSGGSSSADSKDTRPLYAEEPSKELECPVCGQYLRYPVQFPGCGHHCCTACLKELIRVEPRCPVDQSKFDPTLVTLDVQLTERLNNCDVFCPNFEKGCSWVGRSADSREHVKHCEYVDIPCPLECGARFQRRFEDSHVTHDCPWRTVACEYCLESIRIDIVDSHIDMDCPKYIVKCSNNCGENFTREEATRVEVNAHLKGSAEPHLDKIVVGLMDFRNSVKTQTTSLRHHERTLEKLDKRLRTVEAIHAGQIVWKLDEFASKMEDAKSGKKTTLYSPPFFSSRHGYKMMASLCPNGEGKAADSYMSVFVCICKGEYDATLKWPFTGRVTFTLVDQGNVVADRCPINYIIKPNPVKENLPFLGRPILDRNASFGATRFVDHTLLEDAATSYIRDDVMFIRVRVDSDEVQLL